MRRIITGNGADGRSNILKIENVQPGEQIWESSPSEPFGFEPRHADSLDFPEGGMKVLHLSLPTDAVMAEYLKAGIPGLDENGFHRTGTLDFVMLLEGELTLELDDGTVAMKPGDVVVQRDTNHAWRNTGDGPANCFVVVSRPA